MPPGYDIRLQPKKIVYRRYKTLGLDNFFADISSLDELNIPSSTDPVTLLESYERILTSLLNKHVPECTRMISQHKKVPWFNNDIKVAKMARQKAERKWCQSQSHDNQKRYVQAKDMVVTVIKKYEETAFL